MRTVTFHISVGLLLGGLSGGATYYIWHNDTAALIVGAIVAFLYWLITAAVKDASNVFDVFDVFPD